MANVIPRPYSKDIVAFAGKKKVGKSTAADALAEYKTVSIADPIKDVVSAAFRFPDDLDEEKPHSFWDVSAREAMQIVGSEFFRDRFGKLFWIKSLLLRISRSDREKFAIDDVRFSEEVSVLEHVGADVYIIERPSVEPKLNPMKKWLAQTPVLKGLFSSIINFGPEYHRSELDLDHLLPDFVNDASEGSFRRMVRDIIIYDEYQLRGRPTPASEW